MTPAERSIADLIGRAPERIAVFRALYLGDMLLGVPALRSLRSNFPQAEITLIGLPWAEAFVERFSHYVDRFLPFPGYPSINEMPVDCERTERFLSEQRACAYDLALQMHGSGRTSNPFVLELGARITAGYVEGERLSTLDLAAPYPHHLHEIERNLHLVRLLGGDAEDVQLEFPLADRDHDEAVALLAECRLLEGDERLGSRWRPLVGIHPGAKFASKRWMPERFALVGDALTEHLGARVILTGGPGEEAIAADVARHMRSEPAVLAGRTSLGGLAALIADCDLFISNDTGPAHIAVALDKPNIMIFGPADVHRWRPLDTERHRIIHRDVACRPCGHDVCPIDHRCLEWIEPHEVIAVAEELLHRRAVACVA